MSKSCDLITKFGKGRGKLNYINNESNQVVKIIYEHKLNTTVNVVLGEIVKRGNKFFWAITPNNKIEGWSEIPKNGYKETYVEAFKNMCEKGWS